MQNEVNYVPLYPDFHFLIVYLIIQKKWVIHIYLYLLNLLLLLIHLINFFLNF